MTNETTQEEQAKRDEQSKKVAYKHVMSSANPQNQVTREQIAIIT
jgi:hypothetical protein